MTGTAAVVATFSSTSNGGRVLLLTHEVVGGVELLLELGLAQQPP